MLIYYSHRIGITPICFHLLSEVFESEAIYLTLSLKAPQSHFALVDTDLATCLTSSLS